MDCSCNLVFFCIFFQYSLVPGSPTTLFVCVTVLTSRSYSAVDRDCAVGREALQLRPSQCGAVALVSVCGSWRAALGAGKQLFSLLSQTTLRECRLSGLVYLVFSEVRLRKHSQTDLDNISDLIYSVLKLTFE